MRPVVRTGLLVAGLAAIIQVASWMRAPRPSMPPVLESAPTASARCPPGTLPDGRACIPVPEPTREFERGEELTHREDTWIPRRPDRPEPYEKYQWPVALSADGVLANDPANTGALFLPQRRGTVVRSRRLVHQVGDAELLAVADLVGTTVVTLHTLRHPGGLRQYVVLHGHLGETDPGVVQGANLPPDTVLGKVGDSGQPGDVGLFLEVRQVRRNVDLTRLPVTEIRHPARTVACDPRNVFPRK